MAFPCLWRHLRPAVTAGDPLARLRETLDRAKIRYSADSPEAALRSLPASMPPRHRAQVDAESLQFPLRGPIRIALVEGKFQPAENIRECSAGGLDSLRSWAPEALVAPLDVALSLAARSSRALIDLPRLTTAIVVLTSFDRAPISPHDRDVLWRAFSVPVFEQLRGWDGAVISRECEVHDGLHIDECAAIVHLHEGEILATQLASPGEPIIRARTGLTGEIVTGLCECGSEAPRLRNVRVLSSRPAAVPRAALRSNGASLVIATGFLAGFAVAAVAGVRQSHGSR